MSCLWSSRVLKKTGGTNQPLLKWQKYLWVSLVFHTLRKDEGNLVTAASYITLKIESIVILYCFREVKLTCYVHHLQTTTKISRN